MQFYGVSSLDFQKLNKLIHNNIFWNDYEEHTLLNKDCVNIFKISIDSYQAIKDISKLILTDDELKKEERFIQENDRKRYITGKVYSKLLVAKMLNKDPADVHFEYNRYKKPYINGIHFNISHSGDCVMLAISTGVVGIDIEHIDPNLNYDELSKQCFSEAEINMITDLDIFYLFWTRKEALLKATGEGLTDDLPAINCTEALVERFGVFYELKSFKLNEAYVLSTASTKPKSIYQYWYLKH
ncbi:4'-phosphopantetheinyl transferase superfamily protein [Pedobacter sp. Leaf194]|uniref:4'-phosphopantetheinyl transferase family protein n=1 Tax=Pedobacter sp. Leaf194 TaxID=1736297 RepID=UPI000702EDDF|nr:4'-phosphopantetheinyl transferase superfamily protein [Pedobacter sp. Leaf194]KQS32324.1 hypothetical protein ASG14_17445 [Pedobacter sp. Leaf194]